MPTKIANGVFAVDLCTYLPDVKALIISDIHLGFEESLQRQGVLVPRFQLKDVLKRLDWILEHVVVERIVLNGDVKNEFGTITKQEWRDVTRFVEHLRKRGIDIIAVRGNHDAIFGPLARKLKVKEVKELRHKDILIVHGDYVPSKLAPILIIGHEHPAITLREKAKAERFKCFVKTRFKRSTLIVQPAFNPLTQGTDILMGKVLSPLITDLASADIFLVDDETHQVLPFGKLSKLVQD